MLPIKDSFGNPVPENALIIRATEVPDFLHCRRQWYFSSHNGLNLEPKVKDAKLVDGTCWHTALEYYYKNNLSVEKAKEGFIAEAEKNQAKLREVFGEGIYDPEIVDTHNQQLDLGLTLLEHYKEWATTKTDPKDTELEIIKVERRLLVPVEREIPLSTLVPIYLSARLDGIVGWNNLYMALEHKYVSKSSAVDNPDHLPLDIQMGLQILAMSIFTQDVGINIGGAIYNLTRKQMPSNRVKAPIFGRHVVRRFADEIDILKNYLLQCVAGGMALAKTYEIERSYNPQPWAGKCTWGCAFRPVCEAMNKGEEADILLEDNYKKRDKDIYALLAEEMAE